MSHCPFLLPSYSSFLTFASGLHFGDLPLLLLVQPLQLGGLEDPRVHLEHPHRRLGLRAQHHQGEERQEGGSQHPAGAWCSLTVASAHKSQVAGAAAI